jgi:hypothetical protein
MPRPGSIPRHGEDDEGPDEDAADRPLRDAEAQADLNRVKDAAITERRYPSVIRR